MQQSWMVLLQSSLEWLRRTFSICINETIGEGHTLYQHKCHGEENDYIFYRNKFINHPNESIRKGDHREGGSNHREPVKGGTEGVSEGLLRWFSL